MSEIERVRAATAAECAERCREIARQFHNKADAVHSTKMDIKNYYRGKGAAANECADALDDIAAVPAKID